MTVPGNRSEERFLAAVRDRPALAARLLRRRPELGRGGLHAACAAGEPGVVEAALAADPTAALQAHEPGGWTPLLYAAASPVPAADPARAAGVRRCAELLLDAGADPNSATIWSDGHASGPLPALYRACVADNVAVVQLLLERGADPNDGESIYHAAELDHRRCLELLVAHGGDPGGRHATWGNTPLYFLAGYREGQPGTDRATRGMGWLLEHGADPDVTSGEGEETPLHRLAAFGRGPEAVELLLRHGASVDARRTDGRTAYALAVRAGNLATAELLRAHGADPALAPVDELLGACMAGDEGAARALLARHPGLGAALAGEEPDALAHAAGAGREAGVRLLVALGFGLARVSAGGGTPLHWAAWHGRPAAVRALLDLGAPVDVRDRTHGSSPIAWAAHGSANCRSADEDYLAVVDLLLEAAAAREPSFNRWNEAPERLASRRVARRLRERGFAR